MIRLDSWDTVQCLQAFLSPVPFSWVLKVSSCWNRLHLPLLLEGFLVWVQHPVVLLQHHGRRLVAESNEFIRKGL